MRLARITVLRSSGTVVGCRFYAVQHATASCDETCLQGEHLPGPNQPAVDIKITRYANALAAHNGFVLAERGGTNPQQETITVDNDGICYETDFDKQDHGQDWACGFSLGSRAVLIRTVVVKSSVSVRDAAHEVASNL
jgi:hypothetical protein